MKIFAIGIATAALLVGATPALSKKDVHPGHHGARVSGPHGHYKSAYRYRRYPGGEYPSYRSEPQEPITATEMPSWWTTPRR